MIAAVVLLSLAIPPMLWALREGSHQRVAPVQTSRARWLAGEKLEDIIADRHSPSRGYAYVMVANYPPEAAIPGSGGAPGFSRSVSIVETGADLAAAGTGYKTVTVTVSWEDGRGEPRSLELATVVTDYAP